MKKRIVYVVLLLLFPFLGMSQGQPLYTQFFYNKLTYNSAFTGAVSSSEFNLIAREQWLGLKGSPSIQSLQANVPIRNIGLGGVLRRDAIGLSEHYSANIAYAYHFPAGRYRIGLGINAVVGNFVNDYSESRLITSRPIGLDPALSGTTEKATYFNAGFGFLLRGSDFYAGLSVPNLAPQHLALKDEEEILSDLSFRFWHLMAGYSFFAGNEILIYPQLMISYSENVPLKLDFHTLIELGEQFICGLGFRTYSAPNLTKAKSISVLAGLMITENWLMTISYDFGLTPLSDHHNGSVELGLLFYPGDRTLSGEYRSPRFF
jgi:type IX secretion system PorP/SprF family membrane protein